MLEKILGSSGRISILRAMLTRKGECFSINELAKISGLSTSTAFKEIKGLLGSLVEYDPLIKKYTIRETPLSRALREIFDLERKTFKLEEAGIFGLLSDLGSYYVSGTSAIVLRGLSRDFIASTDSLMIICDRKVSKMRGAIMSMFPSYKLFLIERRVRPADYVEGEVYFGGKVVKANLAVPERAVVDALWKPEWEGENISHAVYCLLEYPLDMELVKEYAREVGPKVEGRLRGVIEMIGRMTGKWYRLDDLEKGKGLEKSIEIKVEEVVGRVLRG